MSSLQRGTRKQASLKYLEFADGNVPFPTHLWCLNEGSTFHFFCGRGWGIKLLMFVLRPRMADMVLQKKRKDLIPPLESPLLRGT